MTVFGFGRSSLYEYLAGGPRHFTIGPADPAQFTPLKPPAILSTRAWAR